MLCVAVDYVAIDARIHGVLHESENVLPHREATM